MATPAPIESKDTTKHTALQSRGVSDLFHDTEAAQTRIDGLKKCFEKTHGAPADLLVRAPGRVNIIGEHIDYCGYSVLPMAVTQDIMVAVSVAAGPANELKLDFCNVDDRYEPKSVAVPVSEKGVQVTIDATKLHWTNYALCGYKGVVEELNSRLKGESPSLLTCSLRFAFSGAVPAAAGLSSSSAMVCASALATLAALHRHANDSKQIVPPGVFDFSMAELANLCARSERFVGTEGGGMDQAISLLAEPNYALHIEFNPLRPSKVKLPDGCSWIVTHSLVEAQKQQSAARNFNKRVVECRLAASLLSKILHLDQLLPPKYAPPAGTRGLTLKQVQEAAGRSLEEMVALVTSSLHDSAYSVDELEAAIGHQLPDLLTGLTQAPAVLSALPSRSEGVFQLQQRAHHVYSEALRVRQFRELCAGPATDNLPELLGGLMNQSHTSCSKLYECSCGELDVLQETCRNGGALGSRLTGAGWGGCVISLVRDSDLARFEQTVQGYYKHIANLPPNRSDFMFTSKPSSGAAVVSTNI